MFEFASNSQAKFVLIEAKGPLLRHAKPSGHCNLHHSRGSGNLCSRSVPEVDRDSRFRGNDNKFMIKISILSNAKENKKQSLYIEKMGIARNGRSKSDRSHNMSHESCHR